uniref:Replication protein A1 n=2 Tax=Quercus lobata TaxID=97700 RepID=A0A7N2M3C5_QUELO
MSKGYSFLDQISDAKETWRIRVRICRMWKAVNKRSGNNFISLDMIFIDEKECNEESELIPMHAFEFATYDCINNRLNDNSYLTDMIGKLTAVGPIEQVHFHNGSTNIRNLQILLPEDKELKISLWDESAETITENDFKEDEGPYIIIVTSTTVKAFQGKLNLNTTSATKIYVNLDIAEVSELIDRYKVAEDEYDNVVRSIPAHDKKPKFESELILQTTMSLAEIKALEWVEGVKERFFTCHADIVNIETKFGWNYISCQLCKRKVKQ